MKSNRRLRPFLASAALLSAALLAALPAGAQAQTQTASLSTVARIVAVDSAGRRDGETMAAAPAGDVNGDGAPDLILGNAGRPYSATTPGFAYVVFGDPAPLSVDLGRIGARGFRIQGPAGSAAGSAVIGAGDVNGDGLDDVAVGAPRLRGGRRRGVGGAYVVFGKRDSAPVRLAALAGGGYAIRGPARGEQVGSALRNLGDVSGDGFPDLQVRSVYFAGSPTWIVFGKRSGEPVDLGALGAAGENLDAWRAHLAGDLNRDGEPDAIFHEQVPCPRCPPSDVLPVTTQVAYVLYGPPPGEPITPALLERVGHRVDAGSGDKLGLGLLPASGDVNGDGWPDLLADGEHLQVLYGPLAGKRTDVRALGRRGFRIDAGRKQYAGLGEEYGGLSYRGTGDLNADGRVDLLIADPEHDRGCHSNLGAVYVIYGRSGARAVRLSDLGEGGYRLSGRRAHEAAGGFVSGASTAAAGDLAVGAFGIGHAHAAPHAYLVSGPPAGLRAERDVPASACLRVRVLDRGLASIVRAGRLRARVWLGSVTGRGDQVGLVMDLPREPRRSARRASFIDDSPPPLATGGATFRRPGSRTVALRLTPRGRTLLARRRRVKAEIEITTSDYSRNHVARVRLGR